MVRNKCKVSQAFLCLQTGENPFRVSDPCSYPQNLIRLLFSVLFKVRKRFADLISTEIHSCATHPFKFLQGFSHLFKTFLKVFSSPFSSPFSWSYALSLQGCASPKEPSTNNVTLATFWLFRKWGRGSDRFRLFFVSATKIRNSILSENGRPVRV